MAIDRINFEALSEDDLQELLAAGVPEGLRLDYKRELYGQADKDKQEALKDISSFANAFGGHLIIGIEERAGIATKIDGLVGINPDNEVQRLDQLARSGIEPRIQGLQVKAVPLQNGAHCIVVRAPRSWAPPHRVSAQGRNKFFVRNSSGVHEASMDELRTFFTTGADLLQRVHAFRQERMRQIVGGATIVGGRALTGDGRLILHIIPLASLTSQFQIELGQIESTGQAFAPLEAGTSGNFRFNLDGAVVERGHPDLVGYTQIYRNGIIESTKGHAVRLDDKDNKIIPAFPVERAVVSTLERIMAGLRLLEVPPPFVVALSAEGVKDAAYKVAQNIFDDPEPAIDRANILLPVGQIDEYGQPTDYHRAIRPAFDALWNSAGRPEAAWFNADGVWVGPPRDWR